MTEDEAKTKWCPFARASDGTLGAAVNRGSNNRADIDCFCFASGCMAWRWNIAPSYARHMNENSTGPATIVDGECGLTAVRGGE